MDQPRSKKNLFLFHCCPLSLPKKREKKKLSVSSSKDQDIAWDKFLKPRPSGFHLNRWTWIPTPRPDIMQFYENGLRSRETCRISFWAQMRIIVQWQGCMALPEWAEIHVLEMREFKTAQIARKRDMPGYIPQWWKRPCIHHIRMPKTGISQHWRSHYLDPGSISKADGGPWVGFNFDVHLILICLFFKLKNNQLNQVAETHH